MCMVICISLCWCVRCWPVGWSDKCHMKKCFFAKIRQSTIWLFQPPDMLARQDRCGLLVWDPIWLPDFVLPYLVFTQFSPCCILLLSSLVLVTVLCKCFCLLSGRLFFGCCLACVLWVLLILLWMVLFEYDIGLLLMCSRIASNRSVCLFACFVAW